MCHQHEKDQLERLKFFSDAVFAIAMTLLIIDVRLPPAHDLDDKTLARALWDLSPHYIGFAYSFLVIARFWIAHHRVFGLLSCVNNRLIWFNMFVLLTIAFLPFQTAVVSEWPHLRNAILFWAGWLLVTSLMQRGLVAVALKRPGLVREDVPEAECAYLRRGSWTGVLIGASMLGAGAVSADLGRAVLVFGSPFVFWLLHRTPRPEIATAGLSDIGPGA